MLPNHSLVMEFLENVFTNFIFEKFSSMKHWWREELQQPVTIKRSFLSSYKWKKCSSDRGRFDSFRSEFFAKVISCFKSLSLDENGLRILSSAFSERNIWPPGQRAEIRERNASKSLQKIRRKFYEVAGHVCRAKTVVTNHLRQMFRSHIHKAAECNTAARINSYKLTETNS